VVFRKLAHGEKLFCSFEVRPIGLVFFGSLLGFLGLFEGWMFAFEGVLPGYLNFALKRVTQLRSGSKGDIGGFGSFVVFTLLRFS